MTDRHHHAKIAEDRYHAGMAVNSPLRRMFGVPGMTAIHGAVSVGAPVAPPPGPPPGKGILIRSLERHAGSPQQLAQQAQAAGVRWVPILTLWQYDQAPPPNAGAQMNGQPPQFAQKPMNQDLMPYVAALNQAGIQPWLWGHPLARPDAVTVFVDVVGSLAMQCGAAGILVEPRQSWAMQPGIDTMAANLVAQLRQKSGGRPVGVMSYANPAQHPLPWGVFGQTADFGAPWEPGADVGAESAQAYAQQGFRTVVPVVGAGTPAPAAPSVLWWDWHELGQKDGAWDAVRSSQV